MGLLLLALGLDGDQHLLEHRRVAADVSNAGDHELLELRRGGLAHRALARAAASLSEATRLALGASGTSLDLVVYGLLIMLIAAFEPGGLVGIARRLARLRPARTVD